MVGSERGGGGLASCPGGESLKRGRRLTSSTEGSSRSGGVVGFSLAVGDVEENLPDLISGLVAAAYFIYSGQHATSCGEGWRAYFRLIEEDLSLIHDDGGKGGWFLKKRDVEWWRHAPSKALTFPLALCHPSPFCEGVCGDSHGQKYSQPLAWVEVEGIWIWKSVVGCRELSAHSSHRLSSSLLFPHPLSLWRHPLDESAPYHSSSPSSPPCSPSIGIGDSANGILWKNTLIEHSFETESESLSEPNEMSKSRLEVTNEKDVSAPKSKEVEPSCVSHIKTPRQPLKDNETHKVNRKNWNDMMERELGEGYSFTKKKCFVCGSLSHLIKDCDYYEKKMAREAEVKRVVNTGNGVAKPVWTNANRINHSNKFVPRSVQLNAGRPKFNSVRPNINTGRTNINSVRPKVNTVSPKVNTVRPRQPVPHKTSNSLSPKRPQMNQINQRRDFLTSHSSVRRPFAKTTAQMSHSNAVMGSWGSAVKTSASYNWRNSRPNFNYNSGPTFIRTEHPLKNMVDRGIFDSGCSGHMTGNKDQLEDFKEFNGGSVTFGGSKGYISDTLSVLGKFDGKSDEGFLVGYSLNSKAYRVYNLVTKRVEVNLHVNFLEDKPNVKGVGYRWMFDIDYLTDSMNYIPVSLENQANPHAGASEVTNSAGTSQTPSFNASEEKDEDVELIVVPSTVRNTEEKAESRKSSTNSKKEEILTELQQEKKASSTDTLEDNPKIQAFRRELEEIALKHLGKVSENTTTSTTSVNTGSEPVNTGSFDDDDSPMPELEIFHKSETGIFDEASYDEEGCDTDFN
ncbi:hypothetical protein Tco_1211251 [Tanacetum coccineum]